MRTLKVFNFGKEIAGYKAIRIRRDVDWNEWRVEFVFVNGEVSEADTYFCDDKQDAYDTAQFEFNRMLEKRIEK